MTDSGALVIAEAIHEVAVALGMLALVSLLYVGAYIWRWRPK